MAFTGNIQALNELKQSIETAKQHQDKIALFVLDLDLFKTINATLGYEIGNEILQNVADRLKATAPVNSKIIRLEGDEFLIILPTKQDFFYLSQLAKQILIKIREAILTNHQELYITASMGISLYPEHGKDEQILLHHADMALYKAKQQSGRNNYQFYSVEVENNLKNKLALESELHAAIKHNSFILHYQPQIDLKTHQISGIETLLRLKRSDNSLLLPEEFIDAAEETGLIVPISEWILNTAFTQYQKWKLKSSTLAVNISARLLKEPDFLQMVEQALKNSELDHHVIKFEILENPIIKDIEGSVKIFQHLKEIGIHIAIDDFGIGYSSMNYLRRFPIDELKIDRSLIQHILEDKTDTVIVSSIIKMAHEMGMSVVAVGVETEKQIQFLIEHECDKVQSHFFCPPLPAKDLEVFMKKSAP